MRTNIYRGMRVDADNRVWSVATGKECSYATDEYGNRIVTMRNPGERRAIRNLAVVITRARGIKYVHGRDKAEFKDGKVFITPAPRKRNVCTKIKLKRKVYGLEKPSTWMNGDDELYA